MKAKMQWLSVCFLLLSCVPCPVLRAGAAQTSSPGIPLAPGYGKLGYKLPAIGSYSLPVLGDAADGEVLDTDGHHKSLHALLAGKYTLLSFIYSNCSDINGCPLTTSVFYKIKSAMRTDKLLADNLRLLTLSFDPARDTPEVMRLYGANFKYAGNKGEWHFLTTASLEKLTPILQAYNQDIQRQQSINGATSNISHILRVFLIDPELRIRNIYSVSFLHADVIANDVKTLLSEDSQNSSKKHFKKTTGLSKPGDNKDGYLQADYITRSRALANRYEKAKSADLYVLASGAVLGLPKLPDNVVHALSREKIALGRQLFYDRRLSLNNTISCAMCHVPEQGFSSNEMAMSVGIEGRSVRRNAPTIYNVVFAERLFHDGREQTLEQQVWGPLLAKNEMGNPSVGTVVEKIRRIADYPPQFTQIYGSQGINMLTIGDALASYERTLISADSAFDRWYFSARKDQKDSSYDAAARRGFAIFTGKGKCSSCHLINEEYALFSDYQMHNTGIGYQSSMGIKPDKERVVLAPGVVIEVNREAIDQVSEATPADLGLYEITENPLDRWKYKTPTLRNVALTAPYMHNGSLGTLREVVEFYNKGGIKNELLDPLIKPLNLSQQEISDLLAFLQSLTGSNVDVLVADAFAAPVGDIAHVNTVDLQSKGVANE